MLSSPCAPRCCGGNLFVVFFLLILPHAWGGSAAQANEPCALGWDAAFQSSGPAGAGERILDMIVFDDGSGPALYVVGSFTSFDGVPARNVARWDGREWTAVGGGIGESTAEFLNALAIFDDGAGPALYAGGRFTEASGSPASGIVRWNGKSWVEVGGGLSGTVPIVHDLIVYDDGSGPALYAGGAIQRRRRH